MNSIKNHSIKLSPAQSYNSIILLDSEAKTKIGYNVQHLEKSTNQHTHLQQPMKIHLQSSNIQPGHQIPSHLS